METRKGKDDDSDLHWLNDDQPGAGCVPIIWSVLSLMLLVGGLIMHNMDRSSWVCIALSVLVLLYLVAQGLRWWIWL